MWISRPVTIFSSTALCSWKTDFRLGQINLHSILPMHHHKYLKNLPSLYRIWTKWSSILSLYCSPCKRWQLVLEPVFSWVLKLLFKYQVMAWENSAGWPKVLLPSMCMGHPEAIPSSWLSITSVMEGLPIWGLSQLLEHLTFSLFLYKSIFQQQAINLKT